MGAADPTSGTASIHETIRGFGALMKKGWKPLRTILIASWDAEEVYLSGVTNFHSLLIISIVRSHREYRVGRRLFRVR